MLMLLVSGPFFEYKNLVQSFLKYCYKIVLSVSPEKFLEMQILGLNIRAAGSEILYYSASVF